MKYQVTRSRAELYVAEDLTKVQRIYALAILDGQEPPLPGDSQRTATRILGDLKKNGVLVEDKPGTVKVTADVYHLEEVPQEIRRFTREELEHQADRFRLFCELYPAEPTDKQVRLAWAEIEKRHRRLDRDKVPAIIHEMPAILKAAQLECHWTKNGDREYVEPARWLLEEGYLHERYNAKEFGRLVEHDDSHLIAETDRMFAELAAWRVDCIEPQPYETPTAAFRRVRAVHNQAANNRALEVG